MRKFSLFIIFITLFSFVAQNTPAKNAVRGILLKANSRPLPFTEIELVPVNSGNAGKDNRITTISFQTGKFSFTDVPDGDYTLSINFNEKPTELSPYSTFFYPKTIIRKEAETFHIKASSQIENLIFRLPPSLVPQKVMGKVVNFSGYAMSDVYVSLRDVEFDDLSFSLSNKTDKSGMFSLKGFSGRNYVIVVVVPDKIVKSFEPINIIAQGISGKFALNDKTPPQIIKIKLPEENNLNDKNIGKLFLNKFANMRKIFY